MKYVYKKELDRLVCDWGILQDTAAETSLTISHNQRAEGKLSTFFLAILNTFNLLRGPCSDSIS